MGFASLYGECMIFWIAAACLTGLTCLALLSALRRKPGDTIDHDRRFYEAQLLEIERQAALKLIGVAEADAARTEAARRLLGGVRQSAHPSVAVGTIRNGAAIAMLILLPAISLPVYLWRGAPDLPAFPLASRGPDKPANPQDLDLNAAVQQIETHLAKNPEDGRGQEVVAPVYMRLGRHEDAVRAYAAVLRLLGSTAERQASLGEALVFQEDGVVNARAKAAFEAAVALDAKHIKSRFFLAMAAEQDGDKPEATRLLSGLQVDLPDGSLKTEITQRLAVLAGVPKGGEAIAALPAQEQQAVIRSMVDGLAQRLASTGGTAEEWAQLIRALQVLGDKDRARLILTEARQKFAAEPEQLRRIEEAAKE